MPSEKMRYINRHTAAKSAVRTDIEMTPLKEEIEAVFNPLNIDGECSTIDSLLTTLAKKVKYVISLQNMRLLDVAEHWSKLLKA